MAQNPPTPDGKWMLTELGWVYLDSDQTITPDGTWKHDDGKFTNVKHLTDDYEDGSVQLSGEISTNEAVNQSLLSIGDSVIMGSVKSDVTVHQGPSLDEIKMVLESILSEMGADTWGTPQHVSEQQKRLLSESIESYDGIISTGGVSDSSTELIVAIAAKISGDFKGAIRRLRNLIEKHPTSAEADDAIQVLAQIMIRLQDWDKAELWTQKALVRFEDSSNWVGLGNTYMHRARIFSQKKNTNAAMNMYHEAHSIGIRENIISLQVRALTNRGILLNNTGNSSHAKEVLRESLQLARAVGDKPSISKISNELSYILEEEGDIQGSSQLLRESRSDLTDTEDKFILAQQVFNDGTLQKRRKNFQMAKEKFIQAEAMFAEMGAKKKRGEVYLSLSELDEDGGNYTAAIQWVQNALDCFSNPDQPADRLYCLSLLGGLYLEVKNPHEAMKNSRLVVQLAIIMNDYESQYEGLINLGIAQANAGDGETARKTFQAARELTNHHVELDSKRIPEY